MSDFIIDDGVLKNYTGPGGAVVIPDTVTVIGSGAFFFCSSLTGIVIPDTVTAIGTQAFCWCESLTSITVPDTVTVIGKKAFCGCRRLASITIPESVTAIGHRAFFLCESLTSIKIPSSVTSIGTDAFYGCCGLTKIVTDDPTLLYDDTSPLAAIGYAEHPDADDTPRKMAHLKYLKAKAPGLCKEALAHPALLQLILENKYLKPEAADSWLQAAVEQQNTEATAMLLDYREHGLTPEEKENAEVRETMMELVFRAEDLEPLQGEATAEPGGHTVFPGRDAFTPPLIACGEPFPEGLYRQTAGFITRILDSGLAKKPEDESPGEEKLTEAEFNALIGLETD